MGFPSIGLGCGSELNLAVGIPRGQSAETHRGRDMRLDPAPHGDDVGGAGTAIVVTLLVLLAVGLVTDQLLRLTTWLTRPPSSRP